MLFATRASNRGCTYGVLVDTPFRDLKKAKGTKHGILPLVLHEYAMLRADSFALQESDPNMRIDVQILKQQETQYENNKYASSNVYCIMKNKELHYVEYTSKLIQNVVIDIIGGIVRESITKNLTDTSPYFSIELTDPISNQQELCICLRYLKYNTDIPAIFESFIDMSYIEIGTSES